MPSGLFTVDPEQDLKEVQLNELIVDLLTLDAFVTASILGRAALLVELVMDWSLLHVALGIHPEGFCKPQGFA